MSNQIEDISYQLQHFTGHRISDDDLEKVEDANELIQIHSENLNHEVFNKGKGIKIAVTLKSFIEERTQKTIEFDDDLNDQLSSLELKKTWTSFKEKHEVKLPELILKPWFFKFIQLFGLLGILGGLIFSTYAVFQLSWSGIIFLVPLAFFIFTILLIKSAGLFKSYVRQKSIIEVAKATNVIENKNLSDDWRISKGEAKKVLSDYVFG